MVVTCSKTDGIGIVKLEDALTAASVDVLREQFLSWHKSEPDVKNFVVDLECVEFMDSAGLGTLIALLKRVTEQGGDMKVACLQKKPRAVFEITRAYKVFSICDTVKEAVQSFS